MLAVCVSFYSYDKDRQIDVTLNGINIHNFPDNQTMYIGPGSISVNGKSVSFEGHTHDYAASNHMHTMADITDLEMPEIDTSNLATKDITDTIINLLYQQVNGVQNTLTDVINDQMTNMNNQLIEGLAEKADTNHTHDDRYALKDHSHVFEKLTFENENYISVISPTAISIGHKDGDICDRVLQLDRDGGIMMYNQKGGRL